MTRLAERECVTHMLCDLYDSECFDLDLWLFYDVQVPTTARTYARRISSLADYRVALAEQRRERRESARRGVCELHDWRNCIPRGGVCTPYPQPTPRATGALET